MTIFTLAAAQDVLRTVTVSMCQNRRVCEAKAHAQAMINKAHEAGYPETLRAPHYVRAAVTELQTATAQYETYMSTYKGRLMSGPEEPTMSSPNTEFSALNQDQLRALLDIQRMLLSQVQSVSYMLMAREAGPVRLADLGSELDNLSRRAKRLETELTVIYVKSQSPEKAD